MQGAGGDGDGAETEAGVQEGVVEVGALEGGHAAILAGFAVEDEVDGYEGAADCAC